MALERILTRMHTVAISAGITASILGGTGCSQYTKERVGPAFNEMGKVTSYITEVVPQEKYLYRAPTTRPARECITPEDEERMKIRNDEFYDALERFDARERERNESGKRTPEP